MQKQARPPLLPHFFRSFFLQALWNYQNLQGTGYLFALVPFLSKQKDKGDEDHAKYHGFFNAHPYMASLAVGATLRREATAPRDRLSIQEFHNTLAGPLGLVGDSLFWKTKKPACALLGIFISYIIYGDSLAPLVAAGGFLLVYNITHLRIRWWGLRRGWELGENVLVALREPMMVRLLKSTTAEGAIILGMATAVIFATAATLTIWAPTIMVVGGLWAWLGTRMRLPVTWVVSISMLVSLFGACFL
jgi:mannose/fructose/N-acetylgalactosamine-specific phosphotransferase system component IID